MSKTRDEQRVALVTGANRGIGLEFCRQLLEGGWMVWAACRNPDAAKELQALQQPGVELRLLQLDVTSEASVEAAGKAVQESGCTLDLLIHNAGIFARGENGLTGLDPEEMLRVFRTNLLGPLLLTRACLPALEKSESAKVFVLGSRTGALRPPPIADRAGSQFSYGCSKAAMHRAIPILAADMRSRGIVVGAVDPGWVRTDMTEGAQAPGRYQLEPAESVAGMLRVMRDVEIAETGQLWRWTGELSRWYAPQETADERQEIETP